MSVQHKELAAGRWREMSFCEQMANIGSEVNRAINWQKKKNIDYSAKAVNRALELIDYTVTSNDTYPRLKELLRLKESLVDYFYGANEFRSSEKDWHNYFMQFAVYIRKKY